MKLSDEEHTELIKEKVGEIAGPQIAQILKESVNDYVKDQLKEHMDDAIAEVKKSMPNPSPELKAAEIKAAEFKSGGEFLQAIYNARSGHGLDPRLTFLDKNGKVKAVPDPMAKIEKTAGHMEIGEDSQGGYGTNAHQKPDYLLETPKALGATYATISRM